MQFFCNAVIILFFAGLSTSTLVAQTTRKEQITKVYDIFPSGSLVLSSVRSDIEILTWDSNEVKVMGELTYEDDGNKEDIGKLLNAFRNMNAESSKDVLKLNLNLIQSSSTNSKLFRKAETTTILYDGNKISMDASKIKTTYTIWIPASLSVKVDSKYGKLKMASIRGDVNCVLFSNDLVMGDFGESGIFDIKYSSATIGSGGELKLNVFNGKVNIAEVKNLFVDSKYSKCNITKANDVLLQSFNDTFVFEMVNDIDVSAKYSTIRIENNAGQSKFDFFNSKLFGKNFQTMFISSKYSEFNAADLGETRINLAFNSKFNFATVNTLICRESKYDTFKLGEIVVNTSFQEAFNTKIDIDRTSVSLKGFSGNFKYGTVNLKLNPAVEYNLKYDGQYGQLDVASDKFKTRFISEKNGSKTTIQGSNADAKCNIELVTFNTTCKIY